MRYDISVIIVFLLFTNFCYGQKAPIKFGKINPENLKMETYALDSSASAVVLADYGVTSVIYNQGEGFYLLFNRHTRIKILSKDGYDWANHEVSLYRNRNDEENLQGVKGATYNLEGGKMKATKLNRKQIFKEKTNDNWEKMKFTMPNVKEGSIIEYTYAVRSPFFFNLQDWNFQNTIPTIWSEYITRVPEYFKYERYVQGYHPLSVNDQTREQESITLSVKSGGGIYATDNDSYSTQTVKFIRLDHRLVAKNVPAFREEPFMSSSKELCIQS